MKKLIYFSLALAMIAGCGKPDVTPAKVEILPGTLETGNINSEYVGNISYQVWLPNGYDPSKTYPFLYLLHGAGDDHTSWVSKGGAKSIAESYQSNGGVPMVIVMPDAKLTFYIDNFMNNGLFYEQYMHKELLPTVEAKYHFNGKRAVAGLSMGGFGTLYNVLKYPQKYTYGYAMSPATDAEGSVALIKEQSSTSVFPPITIETGLSDQTIPVQDVRNYVQTLKDNGVDVNYIERSGIHYWTFWPVCLEKALVEIGKTFK